jgi:anti-sigma regulatory factor (Ser/Thr protein kinase)
MSRTLAVSAANRLAELPRVAGAMDDFLVESGLPPETVEAAHLVLDELFSNVVRWAYEEGAEREILVRVAAGPQCVRLAIEDDGRAFDPLSAPLPDFQGPPSCRPEGGLGIYLVRALAERVTYRRVAGRNVVEAVIAAGR